MTYRCPTCAVNWIPYQAIAGHCPACAGETVRTNEPPTPGAAGMWRAAKTGAASADRHARFEAYYAARETTLATLETWAALPTLDPGTGS